jgi:hypothetical protein
MLSKLSKGAGTFDVSFTLSGSSCDSMGGNMGGEGGTASTCADATPLAEGATLMAQSTVSDGRPSNACRPSDAPQRFYSLDIPPGRRATITVTPTSSFRAVARAMLSCDATTCISDAESDVPGAPVTLTIDNFQMEVLHKIITVSSTSAAENGTFDVGVRFSAAGAG